MKKTVLSVFMVLAVGLAGPLSGQGKAPGKGKLELNQSEKETYKTLDAKYRNWLDMVTYITVSEERKVFLKLTNDRDRDAFINIFWLQRDPTPGTPENEYKSEIEARFAYANSQYKRGAGRPGWMTDMGRMHLILGKPQSVERFDEKPGLYPVQVWGYYGDPKLGLPTYFHVVFYQRFGVGEWKLYNPALDGPGTLLINDGQFSPDDYLTVYQRIYKLAPTLAGPAFSMIPNETLNANYQPSLRNNFIMASIIDSPTKRINVSYATNFLRYKGYVNIESSANFIDNTNLVTLTRDDRFGYDLVNVSVRPKKISLGYNEDRDKYFFNLKLSVSLRQNEKIIYQYAKNFEFYFEPDRVQDLEGGGVVVHDSFPVIPGEYDLVVFIENSVGKEFSYFDKKVRVPEAGGPPRLAAPFLGYKVETESDNFSHTYKFVNKKLAVDIEKTFGLNDVPHLLIGAYDLSRELWEKGEVEIEVKGLSERNKFSRSSRQKLSELPYARDLNWIVPLDKTGMHSDYYDLTLRLLDPSGAVLDSKATNFTISPVQRLSRPIETFKQVLVDNPYFFDFALGQQYEETGELAKAESCFAKSVRSNPDFAEGLVAQLMIGNKLKKFNEVLAVVDNLGRADKYALEYHLIKGTALFGLERYEAALDELLAANKVYNSDTRVLNLLGFTFFRLNDAEQAQKALEASLGLNPKQPQIEKLLAEIRARQQQQPAAAKEK